MKPVGAQMVLLIFVVCRVVLHSVLRGKTGGVGERGGGRGVDVEGGGGGRSKSMPTKGKVVSEGESTGGGGEGEGNVNAKKLAEAGGYKEMSSNFADQ